LRFAFSILFLSLVAFAAGFFRHTGEGRNARDQTAAPSSTFAPHSDAPAAHSAAPVTGTFPEAKEFQKLVSRQNWSWKAEVEICRALLACGPEEFRALGRGAGQLLESLDTLHQRSHFVHENALAAIAERWVEVDRAGALAWLLHPPSAPPEVSTALEDLVRQLARQFPAEILSRALTSKADDSFHHLLGDALAGLAQRDPAAARAQFAQLPAPLVTADLRERYELGLAVGDPEGVLTPALVGNQSLTDKVRTIALNAARERGPALLRRLAEAAAISTAKCDLADALGYDRPEEAAEIYRSLFEAPPTRNLAFGIGTLERRLATFTSAFATKDPARASIWAAGLQGTARPAAMKGVASGWALADPTSALAWAAQQPEDAGKHSLQAAAYQSWLGIDQDAAHAWAAAQPAGPLHDALEAVTLTMLARSGKPAEAAALALTVPAEKMESVPVFKIANQFSQQDPEAAACWLARLPASSEQERAATNVVVGWGATQPGAAYEWMQQLPPGTLRDSTLAAWATHFADRPEKERLEAIADIRDPWIKTKAAASHYHRWREIDAPAARRWFAELPGLDPDYQRSLLEGDDD
jgi:hypothetical protein